MPAEVVQAKTYVKTFAALMGLLVLTVGANFLPLGPFSAVVAVGIAVAKAALILLFFMEVRYSHPLTWLFATAGFIWLMLLLIISMSDYATRNWSSTDWRDGTNGVNHIEFSSPSPGGTDRH